MALEQFIRRPADIDDMFKNSKYSSGCCLAQYRSNCGPSERPRQTRVKVRVLIFGYRTRYRQGLSSKTAEALKNYRGIHEDRCICASLPILTGSRFYSLF